MSQSNSAPEQLGLNKIRGEGVRRGHPGEGSERRGEKGGWKREGDREEVTKKSVDPGLSLLTGTEEFSWAMLGSLPPVALTESG